MIDKTILRKHEYGIYYPTNVADLEPLREMIKGKLFLDLGAGDNRVVKFASDCEALAFGHEIEKGTKFVGVDMFNVDWEYDFLYYYIKGTNREDELKKRLNDFKGTFILYYRDCEDSLKDFEKGLNLKCVQEFPYLKIYHV